MVQGIAILGLNGSGKSTLAHALAKEIGYYEIDVEDYYFPEQREDRKLALEGAIAVDAMHSNRVPYSDSRTKNVVDNCIAMDIYTHQKFILSSVTANWSDEILSYIDAVFVIQVPLAERLKRIQLREEKRFGARVREGGDMCARQTKFIRWAMKRDYKIVEESIMKFDCVVSVIDGTLPVSVNLRRMIDACQA